MQQEPTWTRPPRPKRPRHLLRTSIEIGAVATIAIVVLVFVGFVLDRGHAQIAPPAEHARCQPDAGLRVARSGARPDALRRGSSSTRPARSSSTTRPGRGIAGTRLVPELAEALPTISPDRLTYTFTVRRGERLSNGEPVTAASFARALERARSPELRVAGGAVSAGGRGLAGARAGADDPAQDRRAGLHASGSRCRTSARCRSRRRTDQIDTLPSAGPFAISSLPAGPLARAEAQPVLPRASPPDGAARSSTTSARSARRSASSSSGGRPTTASSRPRRSRRSRRSSAATASTCSSCSSRSSRTSR